MRRLLTALMILLVVMVAGLSSLVLLVNPNDFRDYLVRSAELRGYQLILDDDLRWHVWPQLSILTGHISLTGQGASQPLVNAENMRLDVELLPLLWRRLQVKQVVLKNAVIWLTEQSRPQRPASAPVVPAGDLPLTTEQGWGFSVARLQIADSVLVLQPASDTALTVRDLNLSVVQNDRYQGQVELSARLNRNQRDLTLSLNADLDGLNFPQQWRASITRLYYQYHGANLSPQGITGEGSGELHWQNASRQLMLSQLRLSANNSEMQGEGSVLLQEQPVWQMALNFDPLDLDQLLLVAREQKTALPRQTSLPAPVIAGLPSVNYHALRSFSGKLSLTASQLSWRGLRFTGVNAQINNQAGLLEISQLQGQMNGGDISLPGSLNARGERPLFMVHPQLTNVPLAPLLQAFDYPAPFNGRLNLRGDFSGAQLSASAFRHDWQGQAQLSLQEMRVEGLNIRQLIEQPLKYASQSEPISDNASEFLTFSANATLNSSKLMLDHIQGQTVDFALQGNASLDLLHQQSDSRFVIEIRQDIHSDTENSLLNLLKNKPIPLHIYGDWDALNYRFGLEQFLQDFLRDEGRKRLDDWKLQQKNNINRKMQ